MSVDDARCRDCGQIPEMVRGAWWPHPPGKHCPPVVTCGDGLHVYPTGGGRCICGEDYLTAAPAPPLALSPPWYLEP